MNKILTAMALLFLTGCASQATHETKASKIVLNPTHGVDKCKYLGIAEVDAGKEWKERIRDKAGEKGGTHIVSSGPNGVTGPGTVEMVSGNVYFCD